MTRLVLFIFKMRILDFIIVIELYNDNEFIMNIASSVATQNGLGEYSWTVPEIVTNYDNYRFDIRDSEGKMVSKYSYITLLQESDMRFFRHNLPNELSDVHINYMNYYNDKMWLCGTRGTVAFSSDIDFENWTVVKEGISEDEQLCWMDQVDTDIFISGSYSGKIYRTINSGVSWNLVYNDTTVTNFINYIKAFPETGEVIVQGDGADEDSPMAFLYSNDYGLTWTNNNDELMGESNPWKTTFISQDCGYASGNTWPEYSHLIYKTNDLGVSWSELNPFNNTSESVRYLNFKNTNFGVG